MDPAQKKYLILYALIVIPLALSFFFIRRAPPPVKLHLQTGDPMPPKPENLPPGPTKVQENPPAAGAAERAHHTASRRPSASGSGSVQRSATALNVFFVWNGHSWDAYEVLGIPAGSSRESALAAFERARKECDAESLPFLQAALDAIVKSASTRA
jgi:hypothetical protein